MYNATFARAKRAAAAGPRSISSAAAPVSVQPRSVKPLNVRNSPAMPAAGPVSERDCVSLISGGTKIARAAALAVETAGATPGGILAGRPFATSGQAILAAVISRRVE